MIPGLAAVFRRRFLLPFLALAFLAGCAGGPPLKPFPEIVPPRVPQEIAGVPFHPQEALQCGPAALATALGWSGVNATPRELESLLFVPARKGTLQPEIKAQARRFGRIPYEIPNTPEALLAELAAGHPVMVLQNNGLSWAPAWHYAVVVGVNPENDTVRLRSGGHEDYDLAIDTFLKTWRRADYWALAVLRPSDMPASLRPAPVLSAILDFGRVARPHDVRRALQAALLHWPDSIGLRFALANHWYEQERHQSAEREYRRILAFAPDAVMARNNLAWMLAEQGRADEALALLPDDPERTAEALPEDPWGETLAATARFVRCRVDGGSVDRCTSATQPD